MDLGNPVEIVVHNVLIGGIVCLGCRDELLIVSAVVYVMYTGQNLW